MAPGDAPAVSVIIPTYNRCALLRRTLESLAVDAAPPGSFEVVVGDDGSSDDTREVVAEFAARGPVRYVFQPDEGYRAAAARNAAARAAAGEILAFIDTGTLAAPGFVEAHLGAHRAARRQPRVAVIGYTYGYNPWQPSTELPKLIDHHPPAEIVRRLADDPGFRDMRDDTLRPVADDPMRLSLPWMLFWTCNVSVRAADFWACGGFDEDFREWGGEDIDLGYRLARGGVRFVISRAAWALEMPHHRDLEFQSASTARNGDFLWRKYRVPAMELYWGLYSNGCYDPLEEVHREFVSWRDATAGLRLTDEVAALTDEVAALAGSGPVSGAGRVLVVGVDRAFRAPAGAGWSTLCPDEEVVSDLGGLATAASHDGVSPGGTLRYAFGLRTDFPEQAFDVVVLTSRLAGVWPRWGSLLLREANRVGGAVLLTRALRAEVAPLGANAPDR